MPALDDDNLDSYGFKCSSCGQENLLDPYDLHFLEGDHACERCGFDIGNLEPEEIQEAIKPPKDVDPLPPYEPIDEWKD
jgi:DNA-directed RNA polymerase subunit RPC12/RpoP|tara:strand:- start:778 stop:1014 length:237 start_codon:yes stop_codon:yes gene_type:complete